MTIQLCKYQCLDFYKNSIQNYPEMTFSIFPLLEARIMPIDVYAAIQRDFWLPIAVPFFALASHLVPSRYRRAILNYGSSFGNAPCATGQANSQ